MRDNYSGRSVRRDGDRIIVSVPVKFRRRNGRQMIYCENDAEGESEENSLAATLAKAYAWQDELESGDWTDLAEFAAAKNVDRSYAGRLLRLTSLAPETVEAILAGDESEGVSLRRLHRGFAEVWSEQQWDN